MTGWVTLQREMMDHPLFKGDSARLGAWVWLITQAAWKPTRFNNRGQIITLERGQLCAGRDYLASEWGWSPSAVSRFLTRLQTEQMIGQQTGQGVKVVTICNYTKYQGITNDAGQQTGQQSEQQPDSNRTHIEQGNKETIELNTDSIGVLTRETRKKTKPKVAPFTPPDWVPLDAWNGFVAMRKVKDGGLTERGITLAIGKLEKLRADGNDPGEVLDQSTLSKWAGLFEIKKDRNNGHAGQSNFKQGLRGSRPDPALDMLRQARADRAFENQGFGADTGDSGFDWAAIPTIGSS